MSKHTQTTFQGRKLSHDEMSHQHLSNCVWHFRVWNDSPDSRLRHFFDTLDRRFDGVLLPFRPILKFPAEIKALRECGMVEEIDEYKSKITWKGKVIGEMFNSEEAEIAFHEHEAYNKEIDKLKEE